MTGQGRTHRQDTPGITSRPDHIKLNRHFNEQIIFHDRVTPAVVKALRTVGHCGTSKEKNDINSCGSVSCTD